MSVQLTPEDFQRLVQITQKLPDFANVHDRRSLVEGALAGVPQADVILARLNLDGMPMTASVRVIRFLSEFGQVAYGKEALGVFLNHIQPFTGNEDQDFIVYLFERYPLDAHASLDRAIDHWRGTDNLADVREKIIGENTLRHVMVLELALDAAKAVVHIKVPREGGKCELGTGFMIASDLLMTCNHVIHSAAEAETTEYIFNYQLDRDGKICNPLPAQTLPGGLFHTEPDLDYTVVQLKDLPPFGKPLVLKSVQVHRDARVSLIQHPGGHLKQISMQNNFVAYADTRVLQYTTTTLPGSSGSPVFNNDFEVVAIHHAGGDLIEPATGRKYLRNEGSSMIPVLDDLKKHAPNIYARLKG